MIAECPKQCTTLAFVKLRRDPWRVPQELRGRNMASDTVDESDSMPIRGWRSVFPPAQWLARYQKAWLRHDIVAGVTLAAYAIPVSLAYASLARAAAAIRHLLLSCGGARIRAVWHLATACNRPDVRDFHADWRHAPRHGGRRSPAMGADRRAHRVALRRDERNCVGIEPLVTRELHQRDDLAWLQGGRCAYDRAHPATELFGVPGGGDHFFERLWTLGARFPIPISLSSPSASLR